jgi:LuxR family transcriptional regulator, quorum-sensing system regulator CviR
MRSNIYNLSRHDACSLLDLIDDGLGCNNLEAFRGLMERLKTLVSYDFATCLLCEKGIDGQIQSLDVVNINYPSEWIELYVTRNYERVDPILKKNFETFSLQFWDDTYKKMPPPRSFLSLASDFGLDRGYTHGVRNYTGEEGSLFSLSGGTVEHSERTATILNAVIPHFHQALGRAVKGSSTRTSGNLSSREKEVLKWMMQGKSTWDISKIIQISERTVNFHSKNIKLKLNASSRTHAVAIAMEEGIVVSA